MVSPEVVVVVAVAVAGVVGGGAAAAGAMSVVAVAAAAGGFRGSGRGRRCGGFGGSAGTEGFRCCTWGRKGKGKEYLQGLNRAQICISIHT